MIIINKKIAVLDENNMQAGKTYLRRAKQLVARGRASWHGEGGEAIRLMAHQAPPEEEIKPMKIIHKWRGLAVHGFVLIAAAVLITRIFGTTEHVVQPTLSSVMNETGLTASALAILSKNSPDTARHLLEAATAPVVVQMAQPAWYFAWGAYAAYAVFVASRVAIYAAYKFKLPNVKRWWQKRVEAEYMRLKIGESHAVDLREN